MGSLLWKIYSGLLHGVRFWAAIAEIGMDAIYARWPITFKPKPWVAKYFNLQLQLKQLKWLGAGTYTASDKRPAPIKRFGHARLFSMCTEL